MTAFSSRTEARPRTSSVDWAPYLSLVLLLLAGGLALAKALGQGPADLQTGFHVSTFYAALLVYEYGALPITGSILLAWVLLAAVGLRRLRQRQGRRPALVAAGVATLALLWAGLSLFPQLFVGYEHLTSVSRDGQRYHLGIRTALDGDFFFVVTRCAHWQRRCTAYGVAAVDVAERDDLSRARLTIEDTAHAVEIQTASRTIPFRFP